MRVGLVGAGAIAQSWLEAIRTSDRAQLVAVADNVLDAATQAAEPFGASVHPDLTSLLSSVEIDLLVVSTPPATHADLAVEALGRDVSVLCEKPLSVTVDAAAKMVEAAHASAGMLTMASKFRFVDAVVQARSMVTSGMFGEIVWMRNTFSAPVDMQHRWNSDPAVSGGGVLIDNGAHSVDLCRYLLGPVTSVLAIEARRHRDLGVEDTVQLLLKTESGAMATINLSWSLRSSGEHYIELDGTSGHVAIGWRSSRFMTDSAPGWAEFAAPYSKHDAFGRNLDNVLDALEGGGDPLVRPEDALASVHVIDAAYRSLAAGCWIDV
ncbi:MAG TPA: Gfo/Idh/MocA family oxidoreductase [Acidimicrobiales bacterium]|nr:Gfo/Idh/MocA family oxidoreductase [Acidimicrobiales bacterium]